MHRFVNCGAAEGQFTRWFLATPLGQLHTWQVHEFEPRRGTPAVWTCDGRITFYKSAEPESSTLIATKTTGRPFVPVQVDAIDFARWLTETCAPGDFVILAMNIEGAEYEVLAHLLATLAMRLVSRLYVEFHNTKVGVPVSRDLELVNAIESLGIPVEPRCLLVPNNDAF